MKMKKRLLSILLSLLMVLGLMTGMSSTVRGDTTAYYVRIKKGRIETLLTDNDGIASVGINLVTMGIPEPDPTIKHPDCP